jgi:hypothetical protein
MSRVLSDTPISAFALPAALRALRAETPCPHPACRVFNVATRAALSQTFDHVLNDHECTSSLVGDALVADLSLADNIHFQAACCGAPQPVWLESELLALFSEAGASANPAWLSLFPGRAPPLACLQARVGRALASDPDWLLVDADAWTDDTLAPEHFTRAFLHRYPWRGLVWLSADTARADSLSTRLSECAP